MTPTLLGQNRRRQSIGNFIANEFERSKIEEALVNAYDAEIEFKERETEKGLKEFAASGRPSVD